MVMGHKPLDEMINKDVATLSPWLQCIMLYIHQYSVYILYNPGPDLYIADWLSRNNHVGNKDWEIAGMNVHMHPLNTAVHLLWTHEAVHNVLGISAD